MDKIEKFLMNFPRLKHLDLQAKSYADLVNGNQLAILAKHFITFKFIFEVNLALIERTFDTFRTSFWLINKRWFVAYNNNYLYTIPCSMYAHVDESF